MVALVMGLGYIGLGFQDVTICGLMALIIVGNGFLNQAFSTLVGNFVF